MKIISCNFRSCTFFKSPMVRYESTRRQVSLFFFIDKKNSNYIHFSRNRQFTRIFRSYCCVRISPSIGLARTLTLYSANIHITQHIFNLHKLCKPSLPSSNAFFFYVYFSPVYEIAAYMCKCISVNKLSIRNVKKSALHLQLPQFPYISWPSNFLLESGDRRMVRRTPCCLLLNVCNA